VELIRELTMTVQQKPFCSAMAESPATLPPSIDFQMSAKTSGEPHRLIQKSND
jgi:hypothetical protein